MKNEIGFTLVEVMVCIAILCVVAGITPPVIQNYKSRLALHGTVSAMVGELHMARSTAIKNNSRVVFSYTEKGYKIFIDDGGVGGTKEDWIQQPGERVLADVTLEDKLMILMDESTFSLHRTRFSRSAGIKPGSIVIRGCNGQKRRVVINSVGRVRAEK